MDKATIKKDSIASTLLTNQTLNLFGIGSALIGLQVCCGMLTSFGLYPIEMVFVQHLADGKGSLIEHAGQILGSEAQGICCPADAAAQG